MLIFTEYILYINNIYMCAYRECILKPPWFQKWIKQTSLEIKPLAGIQARAFIHMQTHTQLNCY